MPNPKNITTLSLLHLILLSTIIWHCWLFLATAGSHGSSYLCDLCTSLFTPTLSHLLDHYLYQALYWWHSVRFHSWTLLLFSLYNLLGDDMATIILLAPKSTFPVQCPPKFLDMVPIIWWTISSHFFSQRHYKFNMFKLNTSLLALPPTQLDPVFSISGDEKSNHLINNQILLILVISS